jgi:hypothetical protein
MIISKFRVRADARPGKTNAALNFLLQNLSR